jgi:uncharacterized protein YjbI with pentapeptide repeats
MANEEQVALLRLGVNVWNDWRRENPTILPDLSSTVPVIKATLYLTDIDLVGANLSGADLRGVNLSGGVDLTGTNFSGAKLDSANFTGSHLIQADLSGADLRRTYFILAKLRGANLTGADLGQADLQWADLSGANLRGGSLESANLVDAILNGADLTGCRVHGVSAWGLTVDEATQQKNLIITRENESEITVDNIQVAQFIHLLLHNQKIREVIDTITSKAVLILGRFTDERKAVLDALRDELRKRDYLPILFDFEKPSSRDTDETITLLARMARFVIADISDAKAVLQELRAIVPDLPSVPVQSIILSTQEEPGMFDFYRNRPSFLAVHRYADQEQLLADLGDKVIRPAELKVRELRG